MEIKEIIKELRYYEKYFPKQAIEEAIVRKEEIIPILLEELIWATCNIENIYEDTDYFGHMFSIYLLAQFKEKRAFPLIVEFFTKLENDRYFFTKDLVSKHLYQIMASVFDGNIETLRNIALNRKCDEFIRAAFMNSVLVLHHYAEVSREGIISFLQYMFNNLVEEDWYLWKSLINNCLIIHAVELLPEIRWSFNNNLLDNTGFRYYRVIEEIKSYDSSYDYILELKKIENTYTLSKKWDWFIDDVIDDDFNKHLADIVIKIIERTKKQGS